MVPKYLGSTFAVGPSPQARLPTQGFIEVCVRSPQSGVASPSQVGPLDQRNSERESEQEFDTDPWEDHAAYGPDFDDIYGMW